MNKKNKGIIRILKAFKYSFNGIVAALKNEAAFRQEIVVGTPLIILAGFLEVSPVEKCLLIGSILFIWIVELLNSAIEECVDLASPGMHPYAKKAKDMASAAVLFAIITAVFFWVVILFPEYFYFYFFVDYEF